MALEFSERTKRLPSYPVAGGYALPEDVALLASNESPYPPLPEVVEAASRVIAGANRYPDPSNARLRSALSDRYGVPAKRIAIGNGSCDILLAAGDALLEPGAEIVHAWPSFSVYPHLSAASGATAIRVPLDADERHDLDAMAAEITAATRLVVVCNPNNPTSTALPLDEIAVVRRARPAPRLRDPRRGLLRVQHARRPRLVARPAASATPTSSCCAPSPRSTGCAGCASASRCAGRRTSCGRSTRCASRSSATPSRRRPRSRRSSTRTPSPSASSARSSRASRSRRACGELGIEPAESQANFCWFDLPVPEGADPAEVEASVVAGLRERGVLVRAGGALGKPGALRVTYGTSAENSRFLEALATVLARMSRSADSARNTYFALSAYRYAWRFI